MCPASSVSGGRSYILQQKGMNMRERKGSTRTSASATCHQPFSRSLRSSPPALQERGCVPPFTRGAVEPGRAEPTCLSHTAHQAERAGQRGREVDDEGREGPRLPRVTGPPPGTSGKTAVGQAPFSQFRAGRVTRTIFRGKCDFFVFLTWVARGDIFRSRQARPGATPPCAEPL